ncbi:MAG: dicarboxylate/amino acid:cation symporter [Chlamydiota bacterium]|nr:dicarboxylate/amino acid:cation symporter [Chlamydiota bacterium]
MFTSIRHFFVLPGISLLIGIGVGAIAGFIDHPLLLTIAQVISDLFMNLLKMLSLPIVFLSVASTVSGMKGVDELKNLGQHVIKYTLLTTVIAASVALILYVSVDPLRDSTAFSIMSSMEVPETPTDGSGYLGHLMESIPSNILQPFITNNVIGVLFLSVLISLGTLSLPEEQRYLLHGVFSSFYGATLKIVTYLLRFMPITVAAFTTLFIHEVGLGSSMGPIALYLSCIVGANLIQGFIILPLLLIIKGISPLDLLRSVRPALSVAFFSKSSNAAIPLAIQCLNKRKGFNATVTNFTIPLCTTINMNACAGFILTTVLFVSMAHGVTYSPISLLLWIFVATIAAIGNAGVPMGCYLLSSALLASMNVPLAMMGVILPFYGLIDMLESAINVWSDTCVTAIVNKEFQQSESPVKLKPRETLA